MSDVTSSGQADAEAGDQPRLVGLVRSAWRDTLGYDTPDDDTSFFDAGGDSFVLIALIGRISTSSGLTIKAVDVLRAPTIRKQAALLGRLMESDRSGEAA
ncbi:acyl carrier protein [Actinophytocola oryzae]|uniref:Phosphopantetheine binding protein n=1 Tax=Actinophytocola oryzae TaxID=502181 RepID=A0A4R7W261_9PSEU|nr:acyl carrier protein [Actinophytocola oryzae]TDV56098.1 phosphopantetheine binding protein [Actinophytocola oryzae]